MGGVQETMKEYDIEDTVTQDLKSTWKKKIKERIKQRTEEVIRESCESQSKARSVNMDRYELKHYLKKSTIPEASQILRARHHMTKLPCNYGESDGCWLCGKEGKINTEHYYKCNSVTYLQKNWKADENELMSQSKTELIRTANFLESVEDVFKPKWAIGERRSGS